MEERTIYPEHVEKEAFQVSDQQTAEWTVRKIAEHRKRQREVDELLQAELFRLKQWAQRETEKEENSIMYLESLLKPWAQEQGKSISLPSGRVRFRKVPDKFIYDDGKVVSWAIKNLPEAVRWKSEPIKDMIKAHVKATGELPDGLTIEPQEPKFEVVTE